MGAGEFVRLLAMALLLTSAVATTHGDDTFVLSRQGQVLAGITTDADADPVVLQAAQDLAEVLGRIVGQPVAVNSGQPRASIHLQVDATLAAGAGEARFGSDRYRFQTTPQRLLLQGASPAAVRHAVWDLLHRLGHRQYFPGPDWQIVPRRDEVVLNLNESVAPAYVSRKIFYSWGLWGYNAKPFEQWMQRNRMDGGFSLGRSHAYQAIVARNKAEFEADPSMLALVDGQRSGDKLCIANPKLRQLVVKDSLAQVARGAQSISMEPSDGGGWCQCESCAAVGSISDRAVLLANTVAEALREAGYDIVLGMNAYHLHSAPPTRVRPDPALAATVTTRFLNAGLSFDQVVDGWRAAGLKQWGVRDYPSLFTNDLGLPGQSVAAQPRLFAERLARYQQRGALFYNGESSENWGAQGLGYYVMSRVLWDPREAQRVDEIIDEFVTLCFPDAVEPMRQFYRLVNGPEPAPLSEDVVGRLYRALQQAFSQAQQPDTRRRLVLLAAYTRYVELILASRMAEPAQRDELAFQTLKLSYRAKDAMLVHTKALHRKAATVWPGLHLPENGTWRVPEGKNPLKPTDPLTESEALAWVERGVAENQLFDGPLRAFSDELLPAPRLASEAAADPPTFAGRGTRVYWTWLQQPGDSVQLQVTGGLIGRNKGPVRLSLFAAALEEPVAVAEVDDDKQPHAVTLTSNTSGLHRLELADRGGMTRVQWLRPIHVTFPLGFTDYTGHGGGRYDAVFYVPRDTRTLSVFVATGGDGGALISPSGRTALIIGDGPRFLSLPVEPGEDGGIWKLDNLLGVSLRLLNVPVQVAPHPAALLLPAEVVRQDELAGPASR